jgi:hypothetical protein
VRESRYASTKQELAKKLGISFWTLTRKYWERAGRPADNSSGSSKYDVRAYRKWISQFKSAHNFGTYNPDRDPLQGYSLSPREKALIQKNELAAERERFNLDILHGKYEEKSVMAERVLTNVSTMFRELDKSFRHELPPRLAESSVGEIARILGAKLDEQRQQLYESFNDNGKNGQAGVAG